MLYINTIRFFSCKIQLLEICVVYSQIVKQCFGELTHYPYACTLLLSCLSHI